MKIRTGMNGTDSHREKGDISNGQNKKDYGGNVMANPIVAAKAAAEAKYKAKYEEKLKQAKAEFEALLAEARANYLEMLDMTLQTSADAALMAVDDVFDVNVYSAEKFHVAHINYVNAISKLFIEDSDSDPECVFSKTDIDRRLMQIAGEENFAPWDERHKKKRPFYVPASEYYKLLGNYFALLGKGDKDGK